MQLKGSIAKGFLIALALALIPTSTYGNDHAGPKTPSCGNYTVTKKEVIVGVKFPKGTYQINTFGISCSKVMGKKGLFSKFLKLKAKDPLPKPWRYLADAVGAPKFSSGPGVGFRVQLITPTPTPEPAPEPTPTPTQTIKPWTPPTAPTDWTDVVQNADGVAYWAWKKSAEKIESSTSKLGEIEIVISPNAVPDNPVPLVALNLVSRLSANYAEPKKVVIAYVDEKDIAWGQKQIDEFCVGLTCGYDVSGEAKKACNVPTTPCWGGLALRNQRTNITMIYATASEWGKSDPGHTSGTLEAHEYFHTVQSLLLANGGWNRVPRWLIEGGATFVGGAAVFHNDFAKYEFKRYRETHKTLSSGNRSAEWIEKFLDPDYTTGWDKWNGNEYEQWAVYDVGSLASEVLVSIGGLDKFLDLLRVTGSGKSFAQAFESIYGIPWRSGVKIIANAIVAQQK